MNARQTILLCAACAGMAFGIAVLGPRLLNRGPKLRFAVVDLSALVRKHQERAVSLLAEGNADLATRSTALASANEFGKRLDRELADMGKECGCVLLMREAVVAGDIEDLTPQLQSRLSSR
jgi:hypothetical protein